jgi:hypothetical protein
MASQADLPSPRPLYRTELTIDETTAHILAPAEQAGQLLAWFCEQGIPCQLHPQSAIGGREVLDFGNPSFAQEQRIRRVFAEWEAQRCRMPAQCTSPSIETSRDRLSRAGWSVWDTTTPDGWLVYGTQEREVIVALGITQQVAWWRFCAKVRAVATRLAREP